MKKRKHLRDPFILAMIHQGVRYNITPTKREKQIKLDRKEKQKGWC